MDVYRINKLLCAVKKINPSTATYKTCQIIPICHVTPPYNVIMEGTSYKGFRGMCILPNLEFETLMLDIQTGEFVGTISENVEIGLTDNYTEDGTNKVINDYGCLTDKVATLRDIMIRGGKVVLEYIAREGSNTWSEFSEPVSDRDRLWQFGIEHDVRIPDGIGPAAPDETEIRHYVVTPVVQATYGFERKTVDDILREDGP